MISEEAYQRTQDALDMATAFLHDLMPMYEDPILPNPIHHILKCISNTLNGEALPEPPKNVQTNNDPSMH